jgi:hypothetical protein
MKLQLAEAIMDCVQRFRFDDDPCTRTSSNEPALPPDSEHEGEDPSQSSEAEGTAATATAPPRTQDALAQAEAVQEDFDTFPSVPIQEVLPQSGLTSCPPWGYDLWPTNLCPRCGYPTHNLGLTAGTGTTVTPGDTLIRPWLDHLEQRTVQEIPVKVEDPDDPVAAGSWKTGEGFSVSSAFKCQRSV